MNPAVGHADSTPLTIAAGDGRVLHGQLWPAPAPVELVAVVHGLGEHSGRYAAFAAALVDAGCTVASVDWPGHGRSPGPRGDTAWLEVRDRVLPALLALLRSLVPGTRPVRLFGHSMGGAMALDYALAYPRTIDSVVATAPGLRAAFSPPRWKLAGARLLRRLAPHLGIPHGLPLDGLSRDPEVVACYRGDPLVHGVMSAQLYFGLAAAQARVLAGAPTLAVPALLIAGTADRIADWTAARDFAAAAPPSLATFIRVEGGYHELLNDRGRDLVLGHVLSFTGSHR